MNNKKIICKKGIGKANGFPGCGSETYKKTYGLCNSCLYDWMTQTDSGKIEYEKRFNSLKSKKWKEEKKVLKEKTKTLSDYKSDLQKEINLIIRLIDNGHPCIATGTMEGKRNSGHYHSIGSNDTLRFHLENIWIQSEHSNMWKSGDTLRYQEGLINLYGKDYLDYLNALKSILPIKLTVSDLKEKIKICRNIVKELKDCSRVFSNLDRLDIRKELNTRIGIYK